VDDEELLRLWLGDQLRKAGYEVFVAGSRQEALRQAAAEGPAVVLLDLRLPDAKGLEALHELQRIDRDMAVIIMTAYGEVETAVEDCYRRLLSYSMETESRSETKKRADAEAIRVFARNLRELLLAPPLGRKNVLAIDPGIRTGCKMVCLDRQGKLLHSQYFTKHLVRLVVFVKHSGTRRRKTRPRRRYPLHFL